VILSDALPKNPTGKMLKRELRRMHAPQAAADSKAE
jgi:acyl-coenzyme A synthetase/AMP-(fatty) acid ligase